MPLEFICVVVVVVVNLFETAFYDQQWSPSIS